MNTQDNHLTTWIQQWLLTQKRGGEVKVEALAGDGSVRLFYRLRFPTEKTTRILLYDRDWTFSKDYPPHQAYLTSRGIPVPKFEAVDPAAGCLVMEDLGDELLQHRILAEPGRKMFWLRKATELLSSLHGETFPVPSDLPVATRSFDMKKYTEELLFTEEHLVKKFLGLPAWTDAQRRQVEDFAKNIAGIRPEVFAHRDYHTRNLLVVGEALYMIDFQDARLGSPHYDLASLLYDAYVPVSEGEKRELISLYLAKVETYPKLAEALDRQHFDEHLAHVAFQRVVKAAGSFASFFTRFGKKTHLPYLKPALRSARELQKRLPALDALRTVFDVERWMHAVEGTNLEALEIRKG